LKYKLYLCLHKDFHKQAMRLWSLHPKYLDSKGLVALWRESLLAKHVLEGKTKGYTNHPQLNRFKKELNPTGAINQYLAIVFGEAEVRGYNFDKQKINWDFEPTVQIMVTSGQVTYEATHLLNKLETRDKLRHQQFKTNKHWEVHPLFSLEEGAIAEWEVLKSS
jgi:hypothetical protein